MRTAIYITKRTISTAHTARRARDEQSRAPFAPGALKHYHSLPIHGLLFLADLLPVDYGPQRRRLDQRTVPFVPSVFPRSQITDLAVATISDDRGMITQIE